jgi:hypothetical protein
VEPLVAQVVVVAELKVVVVVVRVYFQNTLDFFLHYGFYIVNYAGLSSTIHDRIYIFFRMDRFPTKVFLKSCY